MTCLEFVEKVFGRDLTPSEIAAVHLAASCSRSKTLAREERLAARQRQPGMTTPREPPTMHLAHPLVSMHGLPRM